MPHFTTGYVMIDPEKEELLTLTQAARLIPSSHDGKKTSPSTLFRWASRGLKGVRLEILQVGGKRTSKEALTRFYLALSNKCGTLIEATPPMNPSHEAAIARATARVKALAP